MIIKTNNRKTMHNILDEYIEMAVKNPFNVEEYSEILGVVICPYLKTEINNRKGANETIISAL